MGCIMLAQRGHAQSILRLAVWRRRHAGQLGIADPTAGDAWGLRSRLSDAAGSGVARLTTGLVMIEVGERKSEVGLGKRARSRDGGPLQPHAHPLNRSQASGARIKPL